MGNGQTCIDCNTKVPKKVKWIDNICDNWGRRFCKWINNETWIKLDSDKYLCSPCLVKRQNQERQKVQEEERRKENEKRKEEAERKRMEETERKQRVEAERRFREETEQRRREETKQRQKEEANQRRMKEEERRRREETERRKREEAERRQQKETERRQKEEADRKRTEEAERRRIMEEERCRRVETERRKMEETKRRRIEAEENRQKKESERKQRAETECRRKEEAERRQRKYTERMRMLEDERRRQEETERRQKEEAVRKLIAEAERRRMMEEERCRRVETERRKMEETERRRIEAEERKQKKESERKQRVEAELRRKEEAERRQMEETKQRQREEAKQRRMEEEVRRRMEETERRRKEETERRKKEETERRQREETERRQKEEADRKQIEEAERRQREYTERMRMLEVELKRKEETERRRMDECLRKENERKQQEEQSQLEERMKQDVEDENIRQHEEKDKRTKQFQRSEERLSRLGRSTNKTLTKVEHSQIIKRPMSKHPNSMLFKSTSISKTEPPIRVDVQKDDRCVLQEMIDKSNIDETEAETIKKVLLGVQGKIKSYENQYMYNRIRQTPNHQLVRDFNFQGSYFTCNEVEFSKCIFEICLAVKLTKQYWPRTTQIISLCLLVKAKLKGILLEINTGEGKTCIIAMFSSFLALCQTTVDIVSSSPILAQRDYKEWKHFFKILKISVSCNLIPTKTKQRLKCYSKDVVYGTTGSFASDLLRQTFLMENVRGERMCQAVIVDEVDCMLLDQGVHFTYLSHVVPGMHHIEPILFMIWKHIIKHEKIVSENSEHFFLGVLDSLQAVLSSYIDLNELCEETNIPSEIQWLYLFEKNNLIDDGFTKNVINGNKTEYKCIFTIVKILECLEFVESIFPIRFQPYVILNDATVKALPCKPILKDNVIHLLVVGEGLLCVLHPYEDEKEMYNFVKNEIKSYISFDEKKLVPEKHLLPTYLKDFVENRLINWIENAFTANHMLQGREYLVKDNDVVPVDFESTGVVQLDTKWGDCLHQFLEIKHGKKLSQLTLVTNFMSNQEYFRHYEGQIFGVSGTLGTEREKSFLKRQFSLDCQKIPTHQLKVFKELPGIICSSKHDWIDEIKETVCAQVKSDINKRAVLVICEDINTAEELKRVLTMTDCPSVALYTRNDENNENIESKLRAGDVIVATNIAGRGTDIEIDESVENAGGLFVLVTFLPQNSRIENQVFGRSARKGQPGSARIVLYKYSLPMYFSLQQFKDTDIEPLKHLRDSIEEQRIVDIEKDAFEEVRLKEKLFARYCSFLGDIKQQMIFKGDDEKIMFDSLHEYWAMWLKMNCETKANRPCVKKLESLLDESLKFAKEKLIQKISPCSNISHIIKFANEKLFNRNYITSSNLFSRAINIDGKWAAIAYYNRAYCSLLSRNKGYIENAIDDLTKSQECFALFKEEAVLCLTLSSSMNDENNNEKVVSGTVSQFNSRCQIINYFEENIKSALQQLIECQKTNKEATVEGTSIFTIALGDDTSSKKIETEIYLFWEMGLTEVIFVKERKPFCWKGMLVIALGVLQIAVGAVIIASTSGLLTQLGWGLVAEGVNDICTGAFAVWKRDQEFMKSWMIGKAVSIAVSVASFGYGQVKKATDGVKGVKATVAAVKQHFKTGAEKVITEFKSMGSMMSSKSFAPVFKTTCVEVGLDVGQKLSSRGGKYLLEVVQEKVTTHFDKIAEKSIREEIQFAFTKGEMHPTIDDFIAFQCNNSMTINQICARYMTMTKELLCSENICQFRQVLLGCVKDVIKTTSKQMKENKNEIFEQCKPIFDIINGISCATYNVKQLVSIYCQHVKTAVKDVYEESLTNQAFSYFEEDDPDLYTIRQKIINQTTTFLFRLLKESFEFTGSGILAEKLQTAVGKCVQEYGGDNNVGKETIGKIIAITSKAGQMANDLAIKGTTDVKNVVEIGLDATETVIDVVADENTKHIIEFGLHSTKKGMQALQSGQTSDIIDAALDIADDGFDKFADNDVKKKANFAINATKKGVKALQSGKTEDMFDAATDMQRMVRQICR
ncbi:Hypothetical predicted protein [Mytilus galloprovincialis]|uniref:Uncharacterized protein n=1 Tax=Mytilus galloprovincialis TaxID=29158 RepID=A0A8B6F0G2_MYTGA|nr:Hypothetical predicted protein [Mytilus galloprovincialis]